MIPLARIQPAVSNFAYITNAIGGAEMEVQLIERLEIFRWYEFLVTPYINSCRFSFSLSAASSGRERERDGRRRRKRERDITSACTPPMHSQRRVTALSKMLTFKRLLDEVVFFNGIVSRSPTFHGSCARLTIFSSSSRTLVFVFTWRVLYAAIYYSAITTSCTRYGWLKSFFAIRFNPNL